METKKKIIGLLLFSSSLLILSGCVKDVLSNVSTSKMSCAGIMTNPRCVKSCTRLCSGRNEKKFWHYEQVVWGL